MVRQGSGDVNALTDNITIDRPILDTNKAIVEECLSINRPIGED